MPEKSLIKHCAEAYFTTNGIILFHCVLCESQKLLNIKCLYRHLVQAHKNVIDELKIKQGKLAEEDTVERENEVNTNYSDSLLSQYEDSNIEDYDEVSCNNENIVNEQHIFNDEDITQFSIEKQIQEIDNANDEADEQFLDICEDIDDVIQFINLEREEPKMMNDNSEEMKKENNDIVHIENTPNFTPARKQLNSYYLTRTNGEGEYQCPICDRSFKKKGIWSHHLRRHKEPKLECDHCSKKFHTRTELEHHKRRINNVRPFMCSDCGNRYATSGALTEHMKRHLNIRNVECDVCGKRFFDRTHLKHHYVVHTKERNFTCKICNSKFARQKSLNTHLKIHANKREYVCKVCGADFNQLPGLHVHMRSKHKDLIRAKDEPISINMN